MLAALLTPASGAVLTDIFREIDEELRYDKLLRVWQRHRVLLIALLAGVLLGTVGYVVWRDYAEKQALERASTFAVALAAAMQTEEAAAQPDAAALSALDELAEGSDGYATLARLQMAAVEIRGGNVDGALAIYESIAQDTEVERIFRDLAIILLAMNSLDTAEPDTLAARLAPLAVEENPWRHSARELTALLALRGGETARARELLTALSDDATAPAGIRRRADELLAGIAG